MSWTHIDHILNYIPSNLVPLFSSMPYNRVLLAVCKLWFHEFTRTLSDSNGKCSLQMVIEVISFSCYR